MKRRYLPSGRMIGTTIITKLGLLQVRTNLLEVLGNDTYVLALPAKAEQVQRRSFDRVPGKMAVTVRVSPHRVAFNCQTRDISAGGIRLVTRAPREAKGVKEGARGILDLYLEPKERPLSIAFRIARILVTSERELEFSVGFTSIKESDRQRVIRQVFILQQMERENA